MQYLYAWSKIDSWIGNICHCLCNNPHATANKKTVALSFSFSQCCHHTSPSIFSLYSLIMAPITLPTPASLKERDDSPSLQSSATVKKSLEDSELCHHGLQSWFVSYDVISQHLVNNLNTAKKDNEKLTEQVSQLQAKVQSLQSSIAQSTTINEIHSYEKHCLDLITPATAHCIMKDLGFPAVKEIPNSGNIASLLSCGVTHRSPFAQQWFAMFQGQESTITGVSIQKFANDTSNKLFWMKSLALPTVAQVQVKRNSFAKYIHDILAMQFFPVLQFKTTCKQRLVRE